MKGAIPLALALLLSGSCSGAPDVTTPTGSATPPPSRSHTPVTLTNPSSTSGVTPSVVLTSTPLPTFPVDYYPLRIEFTTTSDWAELEFINAEAILAARVVAVTGSPEAATASSSRIGLSRPVAALSSEPIASITVDIAVSAANLPQPLLVVSRHGAFGGSGTQLSYLAHDSLRLLREINHYWVDPNNPDTSSARYSLDLSVLSDLQPTHAELQRLAPQRMLWAVFYPWIAWDLHAACTDTPLLGHALDDPDVLAAHIRQAQEAGIDGFLVSWLNDPDLNRRLSTLLDAADATGFNIAIYLETAPDPTDRTLRPAQVREWIAYALRVFGDHPAYMRLDDRPLIFVYSSDAAPLSIWQDMFDALSARGLTGSYFAMSYDPANLDVFDGLHQYAVLGDPDLAATYRSVARSVRYSSLLSDSPRLGIWAATVHPGFDNCPYSPASSYVVDREDGEYYRRTFLAAIASDPDWIIITSWNEFGENTHIAPSVRYGDTYRGITRELAQLWRTRGE